MAEKLQLRGEVSENESLARLTTWRVGGAARCVYRPADVDDLSAFLQSLPETEPLLWIGLGSNLLVRDGGFNGTVIVTQGRMAEIEFPGEERLWAGAGAACARVARLAARHGLCGAAFLAGIPGTMGGALAMNAGAFGGETWDRVTRVRTIDRHGVLHERKPADYQVGYRTVTGPKNEWFVGCELALTAGDIAVEQAEIRKLLNRRNETQPTGKPSGGSTFRNPPGDYAARLIEKAGLKGFRIGGAEVSQKHANFILNADNATAADIEGLIHHMEETVRQALGVELQAEVRIVGEST